MNPDGLCALMQLKELPLRHLVEYLTEFPASAKQSNVWLVQVSGDGTDVREKGASSC